MVIKIMELVSYDIMARNFVLNDRGVCDEAFGMLGSEASRIP